MAAIRFWDDESMGLMFASKIPCVSYHRMRRILMIIAIAVVGFILLSPFFMGFVRRMTGRSPKE